MTHIFTLRNRLSAGLVALSALALSAGIASAETTIRIGHVLADTHSWHVAAQGFAADVAEKTEGRVKIEIFAGGQLGNEKDMIEGLQFGAVQGGVIGGGSFQSIEPKMGIIEMPYAWASREQAFAALDGDLGAHLAGLLDGKGVKLLAWWENGYRNVTNSKRPITTPTDLAGLKIRVTPDKVRLATFEALGAQPAPLAFGELYSALQQGVFDAQENPLAIIHSSSFFEVQKYVSMTNHVWGSAALVVSSITWNSLSPEDQAVVQAAAMAWGEKQRQMVADSDAEMVEKLKAAGMAFNEVDRDAFVAAVQPIWESEAATFGPELMGLMESARK
ncbi:DctP family TRAP transporter solute-binding subunit [Gemmobacter fulvus]|uniref:DctP family TRAP transporter solute-binding subunit n=1 Tax=Gemmobacter fulvus TaxID=2840474 RepID=A0A975P4L6_9RHOB|nr:DctP family TRAP transporter solute-binding subunit [Gemmobacter fulvus]MBT9245911.1 DctP family TRAP transporter solute-binding subunit [Gemmobacter fulvus]QWK89262.1 DctP family TRAP transporter solute-binding subunit [Gemmobacter fulvus]